MHQSYIKGMKRKDYLNSDGRKSKVLDFSKWDRVIQANLFCQKYLTADDLSKVQVFQEAYNHFAE